MASYITSLDPFQCDSQLYSTPPLLTRANLFHTGTRGFLVEVVGQFCKIAHALVTDLVYWSATTEFWACVSFWLIAAGLVMGVLAAVLGLVDFLTIERARAYAAGWLHLGANAAALLLSAINLWLRWDDPLAAVMPWGLVLSAIVALLLAIAGWYGGELAYRHKVGVID